MSMRTRVLVVDDSALMRSLLTEMISTAADMEVVGAAPDAVVAREMIKSLNPDVLTLDVQMPKMDGLDFLEKLMRLRPMPIGKTCAANSSPRGPGCANSQLTSPLPLPPVLFLPC